MEKVYCPECGHEFVQGESDFNYETANTDYTCPECGWEGTHHQVDDLEKKLYRLYEDASQSLCGEDGAKTDLDIISEAASIFVDHNDEIVEMCSEKPKSEDDEEFEDGCSRSKSAIDNDVAFVIGQCYLFINRDFDMMGGEEKDYFGKEVTLEEYASIGSELIEKLSGFLGEYFE